MLILFVYFKIIICILIFFSIINESITCQTFILSIIYQHTPPKINPLSIPAAAAAFNEFNTKACCSLCLSNVGFWGGICKGEGMGGGLCLPRAIVEGV